MIGFLIINYNDASTTQKLIDNVKDYSCLSKIVVVDNNSTDDSYEVLKRNQSEKIHIIRRTDGREFGAGINFGLHYLEKLNISYTFISNSDVVIYREEDLKRIISHKKRATMIGPVIKEHTGYNRGWKVPSNLQLVLLSIPFFYRFFLKENRYSDDFYQQDFIPVEVISFCFFFVSIRDIKKIGYFDENVFLYFEENIMSRKLKSQGIYLCNDVEVFHNHSVTINKNLNRHKKYLVLSQSRRYFAKHYNHAGFVILSLLWLLEKVTYVSLKVVDFVKSRISSNLSLFMI